MAGVALRLTGRRDGRLAEAGGLRCRRPVQHVLGEPWLPAARRARPELGGRGVADQRDRCSTYAGSRQLGDRHVAAVAVPRLAVGEGELEHLGRRVRAVDGRRVEGLVGQPVQHRERLQQHRPLPPQVRLGDLEAAEGLRDRRARTTRSTPPCRRRSARRRGPHRSSPGRVCAGTRRPPLRRSPRARHRGLRRTGPRGPAPAASPDATSRSRTSAYAVFTTSSHGTRQPATGEPLGGRGRPVLGEHLLHRRHGGGGTWQQRVAVPGVAGRVGEDVAERAGAVVATEHQPGVDGAGDGGRERARPGHQVEPEPAEVLDRRAGRRRALPAQHDRGAGRPRSRTPPEPLPRGRSGAARRRGARTPRRSPRRRRCRRPRAPPSPTARRASAWTRSSRTCRAGSGAWSSCSSVVLRRPGSGEVTGHRPAELRSPGGPTPESHQRGRRSA